MKYILLDTNIIIDMIIDRRNNVSGKLVESFIKLLDFDEIKLIIPEIVVHETNKHIEEQLAEVGEKIKYAIKSIDNIYGINGYKIDGLEISEYKNNSQKELNELYAKYESNKSDYLQEIQSIVNNIFEHRNCIIVKDTDEMRSLCLQRRIYKRAPLHYEKKESYADAMILETLLHITSNIMLGEFDDIIFVTGNTADFSDSTNKRGLHSDIISDLKKAGLDNKVSYCTNFRELIKKVLKKEVENADLKEEFHKEIKEQEEIYRQMIDEEIDDQERASAGLTALKHFEDKFLNSFRVSDFAKQIKGFFKRLNSCYSDLEEAEDFYSGELQNYIKSVETREIENFINKWNELNQDLDKEEVTNNIYGITEVLEWINEKISKVDYSKLNMDLPDSIEYGDGITFYVLNKEECVITMDELYLSCENGDVNWLGVYFSHEDDEVENGLIEITYGYVDFDDDGGVGDSCDESISYKMNNIIVRIEALVNSFEEYVVKEIESMEAIRDAFELY